MKAKKGFTLLEMGIALGILAIVLAMVSICFVSVQNFSKEKQQITAVIHEVQTFQTTFNTAFEDYQTSSCMLQQNIQPQNAITITTTEGTETISYENKCLKQNDTTLATFKTLVTATFETNGKLIKCTITFSTEESQPQTLIFNKRI